MSTPESISLTDLPALRAPLAGGVFAGISTQPDGNHVAAVLLPGRASKVTHAQALAWASEQGGVLPTKPLAALLFANLQPELPPSWHWLQETEGASYAWLCYFDYGGQSDGHKSFEGSAVALRLIPLSS